ncbi:MAG: ATP-binding protein, partial [Planctomycetota bacterium]
EAALEKVVKDKTNVVLDFGRVEYINSTGISAVIRFHGTLTQKSGALILVQVSRNVGLTMHLLGVTTLVPFLKTLEEAESAIDAQAVEVTDDVAQSTFESLEKGSGGAPTSAPVFVESAGDAPPGTVIMAMPNEGPFEKIFHQRIQKLRGTYHLVHSVEGIMETLGRWDPDLIVVDHRLPRADEFVGKLKVDTDHSMASVIMLYEKGTDLSRIDGFRVWENDYLIDPFDMTNLFSLAESELRRVPRDKNLFSQQIRFEFVSERSHVDKGLKLIDRILRRLDLEETDMTALYAALKEGIDNAVLHGNKHDTTKTVSVNAVVDPSKVTFIVEDQGTGFDFEHFMEQSGSQEAFERAKQRIGQGNRGGLGILLMQKCSDRLEYSGSGNVVRLEKNLK